MLFRSDQAAHAYDLFVHKVAEREPVNCIDQKDLQDFILYQKQPEKELPRYVHVRNNRYVVDIKNTQTPRYSKRFTELSEAVTAIAEYSTKYNWVPKRT